jgi:hypothetical protein
MFGQVSPRSTVQSGFARMVTWEWSRTLQPVFSGSVSGHVARCEGRKKYAAPIGLLRLTTERRGHACSNPPVPGIRAAGIQNPECVPWPIPTFQRRCASWPT